MRSNLRPLKRSSVVLAALVAIASTSGPTFATGPVGTSAEEAPFLSENEKAMTKMMDDMSIRPTGDVDRDFVAMMVPHHQGAIEMAQAELRYGHNEQLRRIAQEIVVEQQQEIVAMRLALGQPLPAQTAAPTQVPPAAAQHSHSSMPHSNQTK